MGFKICLSIFVVLLLSITISGQETVEYVGSSTVGNFLKDAEKTYDIQFNLNTETESTGGELAITEGQVDFAGIAKYPSISKKNSEIISTLLGWDAISVVVRQSNPIQNLSQSQLKDIFTGKITNWKSLGGEDLEIHPFIVSNESATRKVFRSIILGKDDYQNCMVIHPDIDILKKVKNTPGAIGQISNSFLSTFDNIKTIKVNNQAMELTNSNYPIIRPLFLLWKNNERNRKFVTWVVSPEGQRIVMKRFIGIHESNISPSQNVGNLIVYSKTRVVEDGGIYYYPHESYSILSTDRKLLFHIDNHLSENDENPTTVSLPKGSYIIITDEEKDKEYLISIQTNRTTKINTNDENDSNIDSKPKKEITQKLKKLIPYGDIRIRFEEDIVQKKVRFRQRYRARLGFNAMINSDFQLSMRVSTSNNPNDPNSTHVNANDGFNHINIIFDRIYVHYNPKKMKQFGLWLGKFPNLFVNSKIFSEIVWDDDIQPEGLAFEYESTWSKNTNLNFVNGSYFLSQFRSGDDKLWLNTSQITLQSKRNKNIRFTVSSGLYYYFNIKGQQADNSIFDPNGGNSTYIDVVNPNIQRYSTNFFINENFLILKISNFKKDITLKTEYIQNFGASTDNIGWVAGISVGSLKSAKDFKFYYQYQDIQKDAIFSPFANDDVLLQTDYKGHIFGIGLALAKKISVQGWGLIHQSQLVSENKMRFRLDLNIKI